MCTLVTYMKIPCKTHAQHSRLTPLAAAALLRGAAASRGLAGISVLVLIGSYLVADIVAVGHVWVQDVRVKEPKVGELGPKEAALQEVDLRHVGDVPHTPGEPDGIETGSGMM